MSYENAESIIIIRTMECDICQRFDSIMITKEETEKRANSTVIGIGHYVLYHIDHWRIIYFDEKGKYLGDTISLKESEIPYNLELHEVDTIEE